MSTTSVTSLISAHLGIPTHVSGLVVTRTFRSITLTYHHVRQPAWRWAPAASSAQRHAAALFPADGEVPGEKTAADGSAAIGLFLPASAARDIAWGAEREVLAVWVPERLLEEFTEGLTPTSTALHASPLTIGFRTFAQAVARYGEDGSSMSQYAIERLLAEMTFGALLEQESVEQSARPSSLVERARSVMLLHREDPYFSTPQVASELHISARQLQRAFARAGTTPGDMLRRMRVELAESILQNPLYSGLTVEEVARYAGFTSALQLRRALQAEGSPSPTDLRRANSGSH